jgi:2'-5' RNA ligase
MRGVPHALELILDADLDDRVRQAWAVLVDAGLPSQARHPHPTNRPHVTLTSTDGAAQGRDEGDGSTEAVPASLVTPLTTALAALPLPVRLDGVVVLGGRRRTVAWLVVPSAPLLRLHRDLHEAVHQAAAADGDCGSPLLRPDRWVPHVTLATRLTSEQAGAVVDALGALPAATGTAAAVRAYDLVARTTITQYADPAASAAPTDGAAR